MRRVYLLSHDPRWRDDFIRESAVVAAALGELHVTIHHIGSTAIPGIAAKPVIDLIPVVRDVAAVDASNAALQALGYEPMGEFGIAGRRFFRKDNAGGERSHHLHVFQIGSPQIARHLAFRDFLRAHREYAAQYEALKLRLAELHPADIAAYCDGKDAFIKAMDARAAAWSEARPA
jgi:GrpB-like predicted nucleotidyltransferase (UPF0157 family)